MTDLIQNRQTPEKSISALADCIRRETAVYEQMLDAILKQREALVSNDIPATEASTGTEERILRQIANAHKRTSSMLAFAAAQCGLDESATVLEVISVLPEGIKEDLASARDELQAIIEKVHRENSINATLLANAVEYVSFCMRLFGNQEPPLAYGIGGIKQTGSANLAVDLKA